MPPTSLIVDDSTCWCWIWTLDATSLLTLIPGSGWLHHASVDARLLLIADLHLANVIFLPSTLRDLVLELSGGIIVSLMHTCLKCAFMRSVSFQETSSARHELTSYSFICTSWRACHHLHHRELDHLYLHHQQSANHHYRESETLKSCWDMNSVKTNSIFSDYQPWSNHSRFKNFIMSICLASQLAGLALFVEWTTTTLVVQQDKMQLIIQLHISNNRRHCFTRNPLPINVKIYQL